MGSQGLGEKFPPEISVAIGIKIKMNFLKFGFSNGHEIASSKDLSLQQILKI